MKLRLYRLFAPIFALLLLATPACAGGNVGKSVPAAKLTYVSNQADTTGKAYILEFWATWCGPCRKSIPHLNELYAKYKDRGLVIVGVTNEEADVVKGFMKKVPMNYTVAIDAADTLSSFFGIQGIPHACVVDKSGKVVWDGHPASLTEDVIEKVLK